MALRFSGFAKSTKGSLANSGGVGLRSAVTMAAPPARLRDIVLWRVGGGTGDTEVDEVEDPLSPPPKYVEDIFYQWITQRGVVRADSKGLKVACFDTLARRFRKSGF